MNESLQPSQVRTRIVGDPLLVNRDRTPYLEVVQHEYDPPMIGRQFPLKRGEHANLGRDERFSRFSLGIRGDASRVHAVIASTDDGVMLRDLASVNGTFVNRERIGSMPVRLRDGDEVTFGLVKLRFIDTLEAGAR